MTDTIAAVATGGRPCAIGILRLSGPGALAAADGVFTPLRGGPLSSRPDRQLVYGVLRDREGAEIDRCLATVTRGPGSYTGEDTAEIQCHGSPTVLALGLEALFAHGARQAGPGEFTRRAFLNGRLDLTQARRSSTSSTPDPRGGPPGGGPAGRGPVPAARGGLRRAGGPDGPLPRGAGLPRRGHRALPAEEMSAALDRAARQLEELAATYRRGRQLTEGVPCAIVGRPNAGKSTLFNALLGYDRAIVTDVPGTTRDTVEERVRLGGVLLRLIDTAGLRDTEDRVERLGVERSRAAMEGAELILVLWDGSRPPRRRMGAAGAGPVPGPHRPGAHQGRPAPRPLARAGPHAPRGGGERQDGAGLDELEEAVAALFPPDRAAPAGELLTNARQAGAAARAAEAAERARGALAAGVTPDALLTDVEEALSALGELTGRTVREDITDRIFERFCVGK